MPETDSKPAAFTRFRALLALLITLLIGVVVMIAMTWWVVGSAPRSQASRRAPRASSVAEFATLPDDDAYPAALAIAPDGTLYTGSYETGALWSISPDGEAREVVGARERIGSVSGLDAAPDGALFILDRIEPLAAQGAVIWRYADGELNAIVEIPAGETLGVMLPDDIAVDLSGIIYVSDREPARIWRYSSDGRNLGVWWRPPAGTTASPTGLAYDAAQNGIVITDSAGDAVYRVPADSAGIE